MATGITYLDIVNKVLLRLRETEVTSLNQTAYSTLIANLVNVVKNEVEAAWPWFDLRNEWQVNTVDGTQEYKLTGTTRKARVLDAWNLTSKIKMTQIQWREMNDNLYSYGLDSPPRDIPRQFVPTGTDLATGYWKFSVWSIPNGVYTLQFNMYCPTENLDMASDVYYGPVEPMIEGVVAYALKERGEDGGQLSVEQFALYKAALADAVAREQGDSDEDTTWTTGC